MTAEERSLLLTVAGAVSGLLDGLFSDAVFRELTGQELSNAILERMKAVSAPAPLTPRAKYVTIEHAPDVKNIAERWKNGRIRKGGGGRPGDEAIHARLVALGDEPDREMAKKIIGNPSWTHLSCDSCDESELMRAVRLQDPSGEGNRYSLTCNREAAALLGAVE